METLVNTVYYRYCRFLTNILEKGKVIYIMKSLHRNIEIDRLRAFAILMTIFVHLPEPFAIPVQIRSVFHLTVGVDLFFAISGFLITIQLLPKFSKV